MKRGVLSILIAVIGFYLVFRYNNFMYEFHNQSISLKTTETSLIESSLVFDNLFKIVTISVSLLAMYLGIISFLKKNKIGMIGIVIALILMVSAFILSGNILQKTLTEPKTIIIIRFPF